VRDLGAALREAKDDKDKGVVPTNVDEAQTSVPDRPRFEPPKVSRKSGRARRKALCVLVEAFLADCVRNAEVRDKFAATRQRDTLKKGDSLFVNVGGTETKTLTTKKSGFKRSKTAALLRAAESEKNLVVGAGDAAARETKNTRAPKTPLPTPGTSFATPRAEDER
jgi:Mrp family chromosome partitioning ATPase